MLKNISDSFEIDSPGVIPTWSPWDQEFCSLRFYFKCQKWAFESTNKHMHPSGVERSDKPFM